MFYSQNKYNVGQGTVLIDNLADDTYFPGC